MFCLATGSYTHQSRLSAFAALLPPAAVFVKTNRFYFIYALILVQHFCTAFLNYILSPALSWRTSYTPAAKLLQIQCVVVVVFKACVLDGGCAINDHPAW